MIDMAVNPDKANQVLDIPYSYHKIVTQRLVSLGVDMIWLGDDVGRAERHADVSQNVASIFQTTHG